MQSSPPPISLALGAGKNAWDDRELVNAYDAALLEFHIHNPGPGSWLDKATAALAKGQPLPGATDFGTAWYSASEPKEDEKEDTEPPRKKHKTKGKDKGKAKATGNPYASKPVQAAPASPTYQPASPGREEEQGGQGGQWDVVEWPPAAEDEGDAEEEDEEDEEEEGDEWQGYDGYGDAEAGNGQVFPPPQGQWPGGGSVGRDEAIGYALHAQYWAGYWMGIAHASGGNGADGDAEGEAVESSNANGANGRARGGAGSRSRGKGRASANGIRR